MDHAWCPGCDRAIEPKRVRTDTAPSIQPSIRNAVCSNAYGLVRGTGRMGFGGHFVSSECGHVLLQKKDRTTVIPDDNPTLPPTPFSSPTRQSTSTDGPRIRIIVTDNTASLYCSDMCRSKDTGHLTGCSVPVLTLSRPSHLDRIEATYDVDFFTGSKLAGSLDQTRNIEVPQATKPTRFTPVRPRHRPTSEANPISQTDAHYVFEEAVSRRRSMKLPGTLTSPEDNPFEYRMPPGWRPHEHGQWRKIMYGDFGPQRQLPIYQKATSSSVTATALRDTSYSRNAVYDLQPKSNNTTMLYHRYDSNMSARCILRQLHASGSLLKRTSSSSDASTITPLPPHVGSRASVCTHGLEVVADSDPDDMSKGFAPDGGVRTCISLSRIGCISALGTLCLPPVPSWSNLMAKLADRDRQRERKKRTAYNEAAQNSQNVDRSCCQREIEVNDCGNWFRGAPCNSSSESHRHATRRLASRRTISASDECQMERIDARRRHLTFNSTYI